MEQLYIGLMSGTSNDGIDACLVGLPDRGFDLVATYYHPYPQDIKNRLTNIIRQQSVSLAELSQLDHDLGVLNTLAVNKLLQAAKINKSQIKAIGYHGQTIYHCPEKDSANSIQIGDPNFLAARTQIPVVADLRRMDMAVAGQGAPLVPAFHQYLFQHGSIQRVILNIGGIANLTVLATDATTTLRGFDTGPGNALMDEWNQLHNRTDFDESGSWAASGTCQDALLNELLTDPYFASAPPKSTGREYFNTGWLQRFNLNAITPQDVQATLCHLSAHSIANAINDYATGSSEVYVCGGGVKNKNLMQLLGELMPAIKIDSTAKLGLDPDWVEACAFAWLAKQRILELRGNAPGVTGAGKNVILGALYKCD